MQEQQEHPLRAGGVLGAFRKGVDHGVLLVAAEEVQLTADYDILRGA